MPLPRLCLSKTKFKSAKAAELKKLESKLDGVPGVLCVGGDILNLPGWRTTRYKETDHDLIITATPLIEHETPCGCGAPATNLQRWGFTQESYVRDLPIRCKRTRIYFKQQRYRCACGRTILRPLPGVDDRRRLTTRLLEYIEREAFSIFKTFLDLGDEVGVGEKTVRDICTERAELLEKERIVETPRWLAIDEVHVGKRVHCVITDPVRRQVLDVLPNNSQRTLGTWLLQLPNRHQVEVVTMDMCPSYRGAVSQVLSQAEIVVDRYHVHNLLNTSIKDVLQVIRDCMTPSEQRKHMRDPHLLFKSRYELSGELAGEDAHGSKPTETDVVARWLEDVPDIGTAYWLKEQLSDILQLTDRQKAEEKLDGWLEEVWDFVKHFHARYEKLCGDKWREPFGNIIHTVPQWRSMILNYIDCRHRFGRKITNAFAEYANREIGKAYLLGSSYTYEVLRVKVIYGGLLVRRRPPHPLKEMPLVKGKLRTGRPRGKKGSINPRANVPRLKSGREARDETTNLFPKPKDNKAWASRFEQLDQPDLSFDQGAWEPAKKRGKGRRKEKDERRVSGKRARPPRIRSNGQIKLF
jgi:transposase